jgi:hypothetical protein
MKVCQYSHILPPQRTITTPKCPQHAAGRHNARNSVRNCHAVMPVVLMPANTLKRGPLGGLTPGHTHTQPLIAMSGCCQGEPEGSSGCRVHQIKSRCSSQETEGAKERSGQSQSESRGTRDMVRVIVKESRTIQGAHVMPESTTLHLCSPANRAWAVPYGTAGKYQPG